MEQATGLPILQILLLAVIFLSVLIEIKTGGMGGGALLGLVAAGVFFGSQYIQGLISLYHIGIFLVGILFIAGEVLMPTVGILGAIGVATLFYSLVLSLGGDINAVYAMLMAAVLAIIIFVIILKKLPSSVLWKKIVLRDTSSTEKGYVTAAEHNELIGRKARVLTDVRPAGSILLDGIPIDVVSEGDYIEKGTKVEIVSVNGARVVVRRMDRE